VVIACARIGAEVQLSVENTGAPSRGSAGGGPGQPGGPLALWTESRPARPVGPGLLDRGHRASGNRSIVSVRKLKVCGRGRGAEPEAAGAPAAGGRGRGGEQLAKAGARMIGSYHREVEAVFLDIHMPTWMAWPS